MLHFSPHRAVLRARAPHAYWAIRGFLWGQFRLGDEYGKSLDMKIHKKCQKMGCGKEETTSLCKMLALSFAQSDVIDLKWAPKTSYGVLLKIRSYLQSG